MLLYSELEYSGIVKILDRLESDSRSGRPPSRPRPFWHEVKPWPQT
jgi:hypothetical protein